MGRQKTIIFLVLTFLMGCGKSSSDEKSELQFFTVEQAALESFVNEKEMPDVPDLTADKTIMNRDYPIEVALYKNGKWYYDLPNLGKGSGTYEFKNGKYNLYAKRSLFDMYIEILATDAKAEKVILKFSDRRGPRILKTEKVNFPDS